MAFSGVPGEHWKLLANTSSASLLCASSISLRHISRDLGWGGKIFTNSRIMLFGDTSAATSTSPSGRYGLLAVLTMVSRPSLTRVWNITRFPAGTAFADDLIQLSVIALEKRKGTISFSSVPPRNRAIDLSLLIRHVLPQHNFFAKGSIYYNMKK